MEISNLTKKRIKEYLKQGKRLDKRKLDEFRKIEIETGISKNAEGSARVKLGYTEVIAGVKIEVAEPYTDHEDEGTMKVVSELLPLSSPEFEPGPPGIDAIEIGRIIDRSVRESGFIDFKKLCIKKGEKVYQVLIDVYSINSDGNLIDAGCLAAVVALLSAKMPKYDEKNEKIIIGEWEKKGLPLTNKIPMTITGYKIDDKIVIDPIKEEEESSEARLTVALIKDKELRARALQKGEQEPLDINEISEIFKLAESKFKDLEKEISKIK